MKNKRNTLQFHFNNFNGFIENYVPKKVFLAKRNLCVFCANSDSFTINGTPYVVMYKWAGGLGDECEYMCFILTERRNKLKMLSEKDFKNLYDNIDTLTNICKNHIFE